MDFVIHPQSSNHPSQTPSEPTLFRIALSFSFLGLDQIPFPSFPTTTVPFCLSFFSVPPSSADHETGIAIIKERHLERTGGPMDFAEPAQLSKI